MAIDYLNPGALHQGVHGQATGATAPTVPTQSPVDPFMDTLEKFKTATPEVKAAGLQKIAAQFPGGPQQAGFPDPTAPPAVPGTATAEEPTGAWERFLSFASDNPQYLLEIGASLLAPRAENVSQAGHIASGLATATGRLGERRAAGKKAKLEERGVVAQETLAGARANKLKSETLPAELNAELVKSQIWKNRLGHKPTAEQAKYGQVAKALQELFPNIYGDKNAATLGAIRYLDGSKDRADFVSKFVTDNWFFMEGKTDEEKRAGATQTANELANGLGLSSQELGTLQQIDKTIGQQNQQQPAPTQQQPDREQLTALVRQKKPDWTDAQVQAFVDRKLGATETAATPAPTKKVEAEPEAPQPSRASKRMSKRESDEAGKAIVQEELKNEVQLMDLKELRTWFRRNKNSLTMQQRKSILARIKDLGGRNRGRN